MSTPEIVDVIEEINRGGFGIVERVLLATGEEVARKTFEPYQPLEADRYEKARKRFIREVITQQKLPTDLFIPILGYDLSGSNPWYIMPIADKVYSREIDEAKSFGKIPPPGLSDIINSLEYLHKLGLYHRDLKPQNILLHEGKWKLSDLGLISPDKDVSNTTITSTHGWLGSEFYMAPEQLHNFKKVNDKADIYSFGAILHDIFNGDSRTPYSKLSAPGQIGIIIEKCTEEKVNKRFKNVSALRSALLGVLAKLDDNTKNPDIADIVDRLEKCSDWKFDDFDLFVHEIDRVEDGIYNIITVLSEEVLEVLKNLDEDLWSLFVLNILEEIESRGWGFDYCDVLIGKIKKIYELTDDLEIKAKAILTGARLGREHNRWYVMHKVIKMADHDISDNLAERVAIEVHVGGYLVRKDLVKCVHQVNEEITSYHESIAEVLKDFEG